MEYLKSMKSINDIILKYLDDKEDDNQCLDDLKSLLTKKKDQTDHYEYLLKSTLHLISKIGKNHYRSQQFFSKIQIIINSLSNEIKQLFSNTEIFNFFKKNKRILLILFDEKILTFDQNISNLIIKDKDYFYPEIKNFIEDEKMIELPQNFEEKRRIGENDSYICELVRNDAIDEFIVFYSKNNNISLEMTIPPSIYETNSFLRKKTKTTLIEYTAFFGSIQILRFLYLNKVPLTPSLYLYAIHGNNPEIIHFLEENKVNPRDKSYYQCLRESIKCHNNDFAMYYKNNFIKDVYLQSNYNRNQYYYGFRFYNFQFIPTELGNPIFLTYAIEFDYIKIVEFYANMKALELGHLDIYNYLLSLPEIKIINQCFQSCQVLKQITIPLSVTEIGDYSFDKCINLEEVIIPSSVTRIGKYAFNECKSLKQLSIPSSVSSFEFNVISQCHSIENLIIPSTIQINGPIILPYFVSLIEFEIPSSVTEIEKRAFYDCRSLKKVVIPSSVKCIKSWAFCYCSSLQEISIPNSVEIIGSCAFLGCRALTEILIPSSIETIEESTFKNCLSLKHVILHSTLKIIKENAFCNCSLLSEIEIPPSVSIEHNAFKGCSLLKYIPNLSSEIDNKSTENNTSISNALKNTGIPDLNIIILGGRSVGKTSIFNKCIGKEKNDFKQGEQSACTEVNVDGYEVRVNLFDSSSGVLKYTAPNFIRNSNGIIYVFDLTNPSSLDDVSYYVDLVNNLAVSVPRIILGNKYDLKTQIAYEPIEFLCLKNNIKYFEVSDLTNFNIQNAFKCIVKEALGHYSQELEKNKNNSSVNISTATFKDFSNC